MVALVQLHQLQELQQIMQGAVVVDEEIILLE
jgi:hypothetical protein